MVGVQCTNSLSFKSWKDVHEMFPPLREYSISAQYLAQSRIFLFHQPHNNFERWVTMEVGYDISIELSRQNRIGDACYSGLFVDTTINIS